MTQKCVLIENQHFMNNYNNMGGILSADILFKNEIALFAVHQNLSLIHI